MSDLSVVKIYQQTISNLMDKNVELLAKNLRLQEDLNIAKMVIRRFEEAEA